MSEAGSQKTYTLPELREKAKQCIDDMNNDDDLTARLYLSTFLLWLERHKNGQVVGRSYETMETGQQ